MSDRPPELKKNAKYLHYFYAALACSGVSIGSVHGSEFAEGYGEALLTALFWMATSFGIVVCIAMSIKESFANIKRSTKSSLLVITLNLILLGSVIFYYFHDAFQL